MRPSASIPFARIVAVFLMLLGTLSLVASCVQIVAAVLQIGWSGIWVINWLGAGMTTFAMGLALWLMANMASRVDELYLVWGGQSREGRRAESGGLRAESRE
jgi:hypothetical protein